MRKIIIASYIFLLFACTNRGKILETNFVPLWDTSRVLINPGKGWYHHLLDNGVDKYKIKDDSLFRSFPGMDHIYLRLAWSYLEPEEGKFNWQAIDTIIERYVPLGYGISFRISSKETGKFPGTVNQEVEDIQYATPFWVKKAGAKGTVAEMWNTKSWVPDWDDPVYLKKLDAFHKSFAARYDGKEWLRYVDIGSIGEWGEGHTSFSTKVPPSVEEVKKNMDIFLKNYKKSQLICTDDLIYYGKSEHDVRTLLDYAISSGISLRDDSPLVDWYIQNNLATWSVSHPHFYDPLYLSSPIVFELQHYGMVKNDGNWLGPDGSDTIPRFKHSGAEIMRKAIALMHATYIGYHGYAEEWLADNPRLTQELANICGYWYFPVSAGVSKLMKKGDNIIVMKWINKGVAPAYENYNIVFRLENTINNEVIESEIENAGNKGWIPDSIVEEDYKLFLSDNTPSGKYILKFKFIKKSLTSPKMIDIGLRKDCFDKDGFVEIGETRIR